MAPDPFVQKKRCTVVVHLTRRTLANWFLPSAHVHTLAAQDPLPTSPTASSLSSITVSAAQSPTSQQVLTAQLLIALLEATPQYALPLAKVKEILSARGEKGAAVIGSGASTRVLYGCVAKRLVRIDRGGGEQIVRFDV